MSYILEALRKAEQERKLGQPPSLQAVMQHEVAETRPPRRRLLLVALTIAALLALVVMALLLRQRGNPAGQTPAAVPPPQAEAPALTPPAPAASGVAVPQDVASLDDLAAPQPPAATEELDTMETVPAPRSAAPVAVRPAPPPLPQAIEEPVSEPELDEASDIETEVPEVPLLRDMPPNYRADFPALSVEVHVYDDNPGKRWIMIGGRRYREGEALSEGPRIAEITPEGIVFDHRGQRTLYPIVR